MLSMLGSLLGPVLLSGVLRLGGDTGDFVTVGDRVNRDRTREVRLDARRRKSVRVALVSW